jgi:hypothetical protein
VRRPPGAVLAQQGRLLLGAGQRDAKILVLAQTQGRLGQAREQGRDLVGLQPAPLDGAGRARELAWREELQGPDAVAADDAQQAKGVVARRVDPGRDGPADRGISSGSRLSKTARTGSPA